MYYYIFDPPQGPKEYERNAQIKEILAGLGIAGEMSAPTPGRAVEDLVQIAIAKRYSTIVAVGGIELVNRTARALLEYEAVFGIIPTVEHPDIASLIGVTDWKTATEQLKRRRIQSVRMGLINEDICFLTPASLQIPAEEVFHLAAGGYGIYGSGSSIKVLPPLYEEGKQAELLDIYLDDLMPPQKKGFLSRLFSSQKLTSPTLSAFHLPRFTLNTEHTLPISVAGSVIATTPCTFRVQPKTLRIIVGKGISSEPNALDAPGNNLV